MTLLPGRRSLACLAGLIGIGCSSAVSLAQTDEIQVYDANIATPGTFNLTLHNNYTFSGRTTAAYPNAIVPNHAVNGVPEWAYGVTDWFEAGLYLPLYSFPASGGSTFNGFKVRGLFVVPGAGERPFFYGVNFELSYNRPQWDPKRFTGEIRPIIGWRQAPVTFIFNPIFDTSFDGLRALDFAPAARLAVGPFGQWTAALEEYSDFGPLRHWYGGSQQVHELFAVIDYSFKRTSVELGFGSGLTAASDGHILKLIVSHDLN